MVDTILVDLGTRGVPGPYGPTGPRGPAGGAIISSHWNYKTSTSPPPANGEIRSNGDFTLVGNTGTAYVSKVDSDGISWDGAVISPGMQLLVRNTSGEQYRFDITATVDNSTYYELSVTLLARTAGDVKKNEEVDVGFISNSESGPTGPIGPTGPAGPGVVPLGEKIVFGDINADHTELAPRSDGGVDLIQKNGAGDTQNLFAMNSSVSAFYSRPLNTHDGFIFKDGFGGPIIAQQSPDGDNTVRLGKDPVNALDAATKQYVDSHPYLFMGIISAGLDVVDGASSVPVPWTTQSNPVSAPGTAMEAHPYGVKILESGMYRVDCRLSVNIGSSAQMRMNTELSLVDDAGQIITLLERDRRWYELPWGIIHIQGKTGMTRPFVAGDIIGCLVYIQHSGQPSRSMSTEVNSTFLHVVKI